MLNLAADSASELFAATCRAVLTDGKPAAPRSIPTLEVLGASLCLRSPRRRLVDVPPMRVINPAFAAAEAVWIMSGSDDPWIFLFNNRLAEYADNGRLMGAYGPRLRGWHGTVDQLDQARRLLCSDPGSRRAVIQLFDPEADYGGHKDVPCTLGYRFFLRGGLLHMHTSMRSQDLWLGFCYDIFTATLLQELMACWVGAGLGEYRLQIDSLHLYERDLPAARSLPRVVSPGPVMASMSAPWDGFDDFLAQVLRGTNQASVAWNEVSAVLSSYRAWKAGDREQARSLARELRGPLGQALGRWYRHLDGRTHAAVPAVGGARR